MITPEDVRRLADLARLSIDDDSLTALGGDLERIVKSVDALEEVDTEGVEPLFQPLSESLASREDTVVESLARERALQNAPDATETHFRVPRAIEEGP